MSKRFEHSAESSFPDGFTVPKVHFIARGDRVRTPQDGVGLVLGTWGIAEDAQHRVRLADGREVWFLRSELTWPAGTA